MREQGENPSPSSRNDGAIPFVRARFRPPSSQRGARCFSLIGLFASLVFCAVVLTDHLAPSRTMLCVAFFALSALALTGLSHRIHTLQRESHRVDEQLMHSQKLAAIGEIATGIAHEMNNPLAIIHQETQWIQHCLTNRQEGYMEETAESLQEILHQVARCREITHRLLDFARRREPILQRADINDIIEEMVRLVEATTRVTPEMSQPGEGPTLPPPRQVTIERCYALNLPPLWTDVPLLRQVILNLLTNAVHALDERGGTITVTTESPNPQTLRFAIRDTGRGIAPEHLNRIFLPFFTTKPPGQGTGLGLAISYRIVQSLGGTIEVESQVGKGSCFSVTLPIGKGVER